MAWSNFRVHFDEWRKRHGDDPVQESLRAKERLEKRKEIRTGKTGELPPTIVAGETISIGKVTSTDISQPEDQLPGPPEFPAIEPPPSISKKAAAVGSGLVQEEFTAVDGSIPITPIRHTGELDEEVVEMDDAEPASPSATAEQNFDNYIKPGTHFLTPAAPPIEQKEIELRAVAADLQEKTKEFNVTGKVVHISQGPVVTTFEFKPDPGVKYSRVTGLVDDLCLALKAESIRIDRIPGKAFVGIEVPNKMRENIYLREVIESKKFRDSPSMLTIALGKTIDGLNYVTDLAKMPHLLIAGATGAGKSVGRQTLVVSILYKAKPDEVKFIMVDPKEARARACMRTFRILRPDHY